MEDKSELKKYVKRLTAFFIAIAAALTFGNFNFETHAETLAIDEYQATLDKMVIFINEAREEEGVSPLYEVPVLNNASLVRSLEAIESFSHTRPDESLFYTVLDEYQVSYYAAAENLAGGNSEAEATFEQWKASPNHWKSIINSKYTHIGVSYCYDENSTYGWYWELIFIATDEEMEDQFLPEKEAIVPSGFGDIDGDGSITTLDYTMLLKYLQKNAVFNELQLECADCLRDGSITIADAIVLRKYFLGIYDSLPRYP